MEDNEEDEPEDEDGDGDDDSDDGGKEEAGISRVVKLTSFPSKNCKSICSSLSVTDTL